MKAQMILAVGAALISQASARFSGEYAVYMDANDDYQCYFATFDAHDTQLNISCHPHVGCAAHGPGKIATANSHCQASGGVQDFADLHVKENNVLQFCREHFCTCMKTNFQGIAAPDGGTKRVTFTFKDDQAWNC